MASCLPPLVPAIKEDAGGMIQKLMQLLLESDKYAERKGAAYGLAGLVKGLGILSLKQQEMMTTLTDAIQDKKNFRRREGKEQELFILNTSHFPCSSTTVTILGDTFISFSCSYKSLQSRKWGLFAMMPLIVS